MDLNYNEELLTTANFKLAAVLLVFGLKLRQRLPLEWNDIYPDKKAYWENRIDPKQSKPHPHVAFNFEVRELGRERVQQIVEAYESAEAEEEFTRTLDGLSLKERETIAVAHSRAIAQACRECLAAREYLAHLLRTVSNDFKWDVIKGNGAGEMVRIGKNCSEELRNEFLGKI